MRRTAHLASGLVLAVLAMGFAVPARASTGATVHVQMKDFKFAPSTVTVTVGDTVQWDYAESSSDLNPNCESIFFRPPSPVVCPGHSTTSDAKGKDGKPLWDSGVHRADGFPFAFGFEFIEPGTYHYICTVHGGANKNNPVTTMEGDVIVQAPAAGSPEVLGKKVTLASTGSGVAGMFALGLALATSGALLRRASRIPPV